MNTNRRDRIPGSERQPADTLPNSHFAGPVCRPRRDDRLPGERWAALLETRPRRSENPTPAILAGAASAGSGRANADGTLRHLSAWSGVLARERVGELHHSETGIVPVPHWMKDKGLNRTGTVIPGLLIALTAVAAAGGIASTVLELVWL